MFLKNDGVIRQDRQRRGIYAALMWFSVLALGMGCRAGVDRAYYDDSVDAGMDGAPGMMVGVDGGDQADTGPTAPSTFTIGGTVTGLSGTGLVLQNALGDDLTIAKDGPFMFAAALKTAAAYDVSVKSQPTAPSQTCAVTMGTGNVGSANVTNVAVTCTVTTFAVGGTVTGLLGSGLVLQNNGGDNLVVSGDGPITFAKPIASGGAYSVTVQSQPSSPAQTCSVAKASGTVGSAAVTDVTVTCSTSAFTVGGKVTGMAGNGLVLQNNLGDNLAINGNGTFTFASPVASGAPFSVTVLTQPSAPTQTCVATGNTGNVVGGPVTTVQVNCSTNTYTIGGTVTGLTGTGLVLRNNGGDDLAVNATGGFAFATPVVSGGTYNVTVNGQPTAPSQTCTVVAGKGSGVVGSGPVIDVAITCVTDTHTIGGTVTGLAGSGLKLRNNGGDTLNINGNGVFTFVTPVASGAAYAVTVFVQPTVPTQTCNVSSGSGVVAGGNVTNVTINCATGTYTIGGTVTGLSGTGLVLRNNGGDNLSIAGNGSFTFATPILSATTYAVTVLTQPTSPSQTCTVTSGSGTVGGANVTSVGVNCVTNTYTVGGTVTGVGGSGVTLQDQAAATASRATDGAFTFTTLVPSGQPYNVVVLTQPTSPPQVCTVVNGSGTVLGANVTNVAVTCRYTHYAFSAGPAFVDVCATGGSTRVLAGVDDGLFTISALPFTAFVTGTAYDTVQISSNGYVVLGTSYVNEFAYYIQSPVPDVNHPRPALFAYYSDLYQRTTGGVCYVATGLAPSRKFMIEWQDGAFYNGTFDAAPWHLTFEVILNESDASIDFIYQTIGGGAPPPFAATLVGMQDPTGTVGNTREYRPPGGASAIVSGTSIHAAPIP